MADFGLSFLAPIAEQGRIDQSNAQESRAKALAPAQLAHTYALGRLETAQAEKAETDNEGEKRMAAVMAEAFSGKGTGPNGAPSLGDQQLNAARLAFQAGMPFKGQQMLKEASETQKREAETRAAELKAQTDKMDKSLKTAAIAADLMNGVKDQAGWDLSTQILEKLTNQPSPFPKIYDPKVVTKLQNFAIGAKEKAELAIKEANERSEEANRNSEIRDRVVRQGMESQRISLEEQREKRLAKVGGDKDPGAPTAIEQAQAERLIRAQGEGFIEEADVKTAAFDVAAAARKRRKDNGGISADEAMRQVIQDKKESGDFTKATPGSTSNKLSLGLLGTDKEKAKYTPGKKGATGAIPLPTAGVEPKVGQLYKNAKGQTKRWTAEGWKDE